MAKYVDAHFHLDLFKNTAEIIAQCESHRVQTVAVTNAPSVFAHTKAITAGTDYIYAAAGLHPELVASHEHELPELLRLIGETRFIGEVGIDHTTADLALRRRQRDLFIAVLDRAAQYRDRVLTVHSRRAAGAVIDCIGREYPGTVILHWFSGSKRDLRRAVEAECYFSVNPAMTRSVRGRELIAEMPREKVLTETDGPFVETDGRGLTPRDVEAAIGGIATIWEEEVESVAAAILSNWAIAAGESA